MPDAITLVRTAAVRATAFATIIAATVPILKLAVAIFAVLHDTVTPLMTTWTVPVVVMDTVGVVGGGGRGGAAVPAH